MSLSRNTGITWKAEEGAELQRPEVIRWPSRRLRGSRYVSRE